MNEQLLQYIWKYRLYNSMHLYSICNKKIIVVHPGIHNTNQGPDFLNARINADDSLWAGNIELHVKSSDWKLHKHSEDEQYSNLILHVVWNHDEELNLPFPTLEIQSHVPKLLLHRYYTLLKENSFIACEKNIHSVSPIVISKWKERMLIERLQHKSSYIASLITESRGDWDEVCWWVLAKNFGGKINGDAFEIIAKSIPIKILLKNRYSLLKIESIIFGQSGLLSKKWKDEYQNRLEQEYQYCKSTYQLKSPKVMLKFLRMRPPNFPTIKLAQLATFVYQNERLFSSIKKYAENENSIAGISVTVSEYWNHHYCFDDDSVYKIKMLGKASVQNILINSFVTILYAYGYYYNDEGKKNKAIKLLTVLKAESNSIVHGFTKLNIPIQNAFDSQSILHLYNSYCHPKRCLECAIGYGIFKTDVNPE